jgi:hypothetical protein
MRRAASVSLLAAAMCLSVSTVERSGTERSGTDGTEWDNGVGQTEWDRRSGTDETFTGKPEVREQVNPSVGFSPRDSAPTGR